LKSGKYFKEKTGQLIEENIYSDNRLLLETI